MLRSPIATAVTVTNFSDTTADGFLVEASSDGGTTFGPVGTVRADATGFLVNDLSSGMVYLFRITPFNAAGQGTATTIDSGVETTNDHTDGWYQVAFNDPDNPTATSEDFTSPGSTTIYSDTGTLSLTNGGWVQAASAADAVQKALSGSVTTDHGPATFTLGTSGALRYNPDFQFDGTDYGPAVVLEDEFNDLGHGDGDYNDAFVPLTVNNLVMVTSATDDQTLYSVPSGHVSVGTFSTTAVDSSSGDYSATVAFEDSTSISATITSLGDGYFGVYLSSIPSGEPTNSYALQITQTATGVVSQSALGTAAANIAPTAVRATPSFKRGSRLPGLATAAFLQPRNFSSPVYGQESLLTWSRRKINTLIWPKLPDAPDARTPESIMFDHVYSTSSTTYKSVVEELADWIADVKSINRDTLHNTAMKYVIPLQFVNALTTALTNTSDMDVYNYVQSKINPAGTTKIDSEWKDPDLYAVSIRSDEPNSGDYKPGQSDTRRQAPTVPVQFGNITVQSVHDDMLEIQRNGVGNSKLTYINVAGNPFLVSPRNWNADPEYTRYADILSQDYYPINNPQGPHHDDFPGELDRLSSIMNILNSGLSPDDPYHKQPYKGRSAVLQGFLDSGAQTDVGANNASFATASQMNDEYQRLRAVGVRGITWFTSSLERDDNTNREEVKEIAALNQDFLKQ